MKRISLFIFFAVIATMVFGQTITEYRKGTERGDFYMQYNLGYCYYHGQGVVKDYTKVLYWFCKAAEQGNA